MSKHLVAPSKNTREMMGSPPQLNHRNSTIASLCHRELFPIKKYSWIMDALLMFDVLIYLNSYYYPLFAISLPLMTVAKFFSPNYTTPEWIAVDASVVATLIMSDFLKMYLFRKQREQRQGFAVIIAVFFTVISLLCILYILIQQEKVMRMEYIICSITFCLFVTEIAFGILKFMPCCQKNEYI